MPIKPLELISQSYRKQQRALHEAPRGYGQRGDKWAGVVRELLDDYDCGSVLDYGCGQGALAVSLKDTITRGVRISEYDPAIPGKDAMPSFADMVNCTDVLEHVEPASLDAVLRHLRMLARKVLWVVVSTCETAKVLEDGRNAHLIVENAAWWAGRLDSAGFVVLPAPASARQRPDKEWMAVLTP